MKPTLRTILLMVFVFVTVIVIAASATLTVAMEAALNAARTASLIEEKSTNLDNARWTITTATPVSGKFNLELKSDIGNLKEIKEVRSYAISNDGRQVAISTAAGVQILTLADDTRVEIAIPFAYTGDVGKVFSWSYDDAHIAVIVAELTNASQKHLLTFNREGEMELDIQRNFASQNGALLPAKFSPNGNYILTVIDDKNLVVFDRLGTEVASISTTKQASTNLFYFWDEEDGINYAVMSPTQEVNFADETQFTRVELVR